MSNCLLREFVAADQKITESHYENLSAFGIPRAVWCGTGGSLIGVQKVRSIERGYYQPGEPGRPYYVCPIGSHASGIWQFLDDLCAWSPSQPNCWFMRTGNGFMLNPDEPERCRIHQEPIELHATPLDWLRAGGRGAVILDWSVHLPIYFRGVRNIICDSIDLAGRVHSALNDIGSVPHIHVAREAVNVAA
jgi:hypothetical protein